MSAIVGMVRLDSAPLDTAAPTRMLERLAHRAPDGRHVWSGERAVLGHGMLGTTRESLAERQPIHSRERGLVLVADARIDNRDELSANLGLPAPESAGLADSALILAAYEKWGIDCAAKLIGDFAFAIWDSPRGQLFCARDPMGVRGLFYYTNERVFAFASEIKALFEVPGIPREVDEEHLADYLIGSSEDRSRTCFSGIRQLPAGHTLIFRPAGVRQQCYWEWNPRRELKLGSDGEFAEAFRAVFTEAVRSRLRSAFPIGTTLSGGLDSSSITCVARELLKGSEPPTALHTFSAIFPGLSAQDLRRIDERHYVAAVLAGGDVVAHEILADRLNPLNEIEQVQRYLDHPGVPFNLYMHLAIYGEAQRHGVRALLDGVDGDTTVSHGFERLPELAKQLRFGRLVKEARAVSRRAPSQSWTTWRVLKTYALSPLLPRRRAAVGFQDLLSDDFAKRWDIPGRIRRQENAAPRFRDARSVHLDSFQSPIIPHVLELADKAAAAYGLEPRYPFFDRRLMEFCLALPAEQKLSDGWSRLILRRAMHGVLPPELQWRNSKANLSPNFNRAMRESAVATLERVIATNRSPAIGRILDFGALAKLQARYAQQPSDRDAMTLFTALTLITWMSTNGRP